MNQKITTTANHVLGEGRFTIFRVGVGGSGTIGSSGKTFETGDFATKRQIDTQDIGYSCFIIQF
ncbi:hypothetical protein [Natranaerovirga hydrolytica]|uniref:hypothetical protein n=1 Tax=Natranaerovirga hydrolytica TaxID=680378 RepID=UPI00104DC969|nr:hypothetical protein [Natranaerovirga hydrolytica]